MTKASRVWSARTPPEQLWGRRTLAPSLSPVTFLFVNRLAQPEAEIERDITEMVRIDWQ